MSIAPNGHKKALRSVRTLISASPQTRRSLLRSSRTLKTASIRFSIDIKVLKDLKRGRAKKTVHAAAAWRSSIAGDRPPHYGVLAFFLFRSGSGDPELQRPAQHRPTL